MSQEQTKISLFSKIESQSGASALIKESSIWIAMVVVISQILGIFAYGISLENIIALIVDVVFYAVIIFSMIKWQSKIAALLLLLLILYSGYSTISIGITEKSLSGFQLILSAFSVWVCVRALEATLKLKPKSVDGIGT
ncbi:hypothetical protein ACPUVO_15650 [Pseudocolwellia sp. HL-MZ19]|uniref:hypothetical protein n=1 Tax=Pseudocolwellia sp. HL-MZ19 TaxID=3400846 RepID=UPI003CF8DCA2